MNVKHFRFICKLLSGLFKGLATVGIGIVVLGFYLVLFTDTGSFNFEIDGFSLFVSQSYIEEEIFSTAALIVSPYIIGLFAYVLFKGSSLLDQLEAGHSPFNSTFAYNLKKISLVLIISDISTPLLYSLFVTLLADGHYFNIALGSSFVIGLILYAVAEIFNYGIELQELSDDTI
ncbi:hypothetical protein GCM10008932_08870 [Alkalibacterium iburiense]|uniref:DUF2975 domain-containing protein n=1 Tax=Alkalibacterium iburiense TaxID=290589 RepID=A0ABN0XA44_9LACT